jgi:heme-degrading monooxygenase HmoA
MSMVLESAVLNVNRGQECDFEAAFGKAKSIIASMPGFISLQLQRCIEDRSRYLLLVYWETLEHHTVGFRLSREYQRWKGLLPGCLGICGERELFVAWHKSQNS